MSKRTHVLSDEQLTKLINRTREYYLRALAKERILSREQCERALEFTVLLDRDDGVLGPLLGKLSDRISPPDADAYSFRIARIIDMTDPPSLPVEDLTEGGDPTDDFLGG